MSISSLIWRHWLGVYAAQFLIHNTFVGYLFKKNIQVNQFNGLRFWQKKNIITKFKNDVSGWVLRKK